MRTTLVRLALGIATLAGLSGCVSRDSQPLFTVRFDGEYGHITGGVTHFSSDGGKSWDSFSRPGLAILDDYPAAEARQQIRLNSDGWLLIGWRKTVAAYREGQLIDRFGVQELNDLININSVSVGTDSSVVVTDGSTLLETMDGGMWHRVEHPLNIVRAVLHVGDSLCISDESQLVCRHAETLKWSPIMSFRSNATSIRAYERHLWVAGYDGYCQQFEVTNDGVPVPGRIYSLAGDSTPIDMATSDSTLLILRRTGVVVALSRTTGEVVSTWSPAARILSVELGPDGTAYAVGGSSGSFGMISSAVAFKSTDLKSWQPMVFDAVQDSSSLGVPIRRAPF